MSQRVTQSAIVMLLLVLPLGLLAQEATTDSATTPRLLAVEIGNHTVVYLSDSVLTWQGDSLPLSALVARLSSSGTRCPMPVLVPFPGATVPMPVHKPDSLVPVPMPTARPRCFNPLLRRP
jgi:hypothetical protein